MENNTNEDNNHSEDQDPDFEATNIIDPEDRMDLGFVAVGLTRIGDVKIPDKFYNRFRTGVEEIDYLFGEGFLPGSVITCCGVAGTGKTTFWMQTLVRLQNNGLNVGYFSGEESIEQLAYKSTKLNVTDVPVANEKSLEKIIEAIETGLDFIIIDSFQSLLCEDASHLRGRRLQQHMINMICKAGQDNDCTIVVIMHMTKAGQLKGDTCVPHTADVNMIIRNGFKEYGDKNIRILDIPTKNRFGACVETLALMTSSGYSFNVQVEPVEGAESDKGPRSNKRSDKKQEEMTRILAMPFAAIVPQMVMTELKVDYNYAYGRLVELMKNNKLRKIGKGTDAIFQKI
jgi:archaellum biogenesis ATPase FlaH